MCVGVCVCVSFWPFSLEMLIQQLFFSEQRVFISEALLVFTGGTEPKAL